MNWTPEEILNIRVLHQGECLSRLDVSVAFIPDRIVFTYKDKVLTLDEVPYPVLEAVHNILNSEKCDYTDGELCIFNNLIKSGTAFSIETVPQTIYCKSVHSTQNTMDVADLCLDTITLLENGAVETMWDNLLDFIRLNYCYDRMDYVIDGKYTTLNLEKLLQIVSEQTPAETLDYFKSMREAITK